MPSPRWTPSRRAAALAGLAACAAAWGAAPARAQVYVPDAFSHEVVVGDLSLPTAIAFLPDGRLLFAEQTTGKIRLIVNDALAADLGTVPNVNVAGFERGLLGLAVDPGWPGRPYLYIHHDNTLAGTIRISRFTVTGDLAFTGAGALAFDPASRFDLVDDIPDAASIHNGGTVRFGPDGMLYASLGEDNNRCAAQDTSTLRGVILRLDVSRLPAGPGSAARALVTPSDNPFVGSTDANRRLIWALGLRNPFRFHVDPADGALFIADVGFAEWEEIDRAPSGGRNFGWPRFEGPDAFETCPQATVAYTAPIHFYGRGTSAAVIGGVVYRAPDGAAIPFPIEYEGDYFFSDYYDGRLRRLTGAGDAWAIADTVPGQPAGSDWGEGFGGVTDYAIGPEGSLWFCRQTNGAASSGTIERVVAVAGTPRPRPRPLGVTFGPAVPSPASGGVRFDYALTQAARVSLDLHDLGGRRVRRLIEGRDDAAGPHAQPWDGLDDDGRLVRSGVYVAKLEAGGIVLTRRVVVVR